MPVIAGYQVVAAVPGATNLTANMLTSDMIMSLATADPHSAQTTLADLQKYFAAPVADDMLWSDGSQALWSDGSPVVWG